MALGMPVIGTADIIQPLFGTADVIHVSPDGYQVTPSQNSPGTASFKATLDRKNKTIEYELTWHNLKDDILQSHIHFGRRATEGDIVLFLCTNLDNTPSSATTAPVCGHSTDGMAKGTLHEGDIVAVAFAGIEPKQQLLPFKDFETLVKAIDAGATYVVVHTKAQPDGELRAQIPGKVKN